MGELEPSEAALWSKLTDELLEFEDGYETASSFARRLMDRFDIKLKSEMTKDQPMTWRDISTAPKDETVRLRGPGWEGIGRMHNRGMTIDEVEMNGTGKCGFNDITDWQPLHRLDATNPTPSA